MLAEIGPVWMVLIGSSKDGARTFIMPCTVGVHAEKFTILGGCSLQWQGHHSPTSNYIEDPVATDNSNDDGEGYDPTDHPEALVLDLDPPSRPGRRLLG